MTNSLDEKLRKVEDEHATEFVDAHLTTHNQQRRDAANRYLGGILTMDRLKEHLNSQVIQALIAVEEEKLYLEFECKTFAEFLDNKKLSPMSSSTFYRMRDMLLAEGHTKFDLLTEWGVPTRIRKQLEAGDITVDGDEIVIGDERVQIGDSPKVIKEILEKLVTDKNSLKTNLEKAEAKAEKQADRITQGEDEINELRRSLDAMNEGTYYDRAFAHAINSLLLLQEAIGQMADDERSQKAQNGIDNLWTQILKVRQSFGINYGFAEPTASKASDSSVTSLASKVIAEDDDFGDEEER